MDGEPLMDSKGILFRDYWCTSYLEWLGLLQAARRRIFLRPFAGLMAWGIAVSVYRSWCFENEKM
jgi:hypothetical protein